MLMIKYGRSLEKTIGSPRNSGLGSMAFKDSEYHTKIKYIPGVTSSARLLFTPAKSAPYTKLEVQHVSRVMIVVCRCSELKSMVECDT